MVDKISENVIRRSRSQLFVLADIYAIQRATVIFMHVCKRTTMGRYELYIHVIHGMRKVGNFAFTK